MPEDRNLYNSYFYNAHENTSVLDKFILHGRQTYQYTDGGSALHCNLEEHLSNSKSGVDVIKAGRIISRVKQLTTPLEMVSKNLRK